MFRRAKNKVVNELILKMIMKKIHNFIFIEKVFSNLKTKNFPKCLIAGNNFWGCKLLKKLNSFFLTKN